MAGDEPYQCHQWVGRKFWRGLDFFISPHSPQHRFSHLLFIHCSFSQFHNKLYFEAIKFVIIFLKLRKVCFLPFHFLYPKALRVFIRKHFARILKVQHYFKKQQIHGWVDQIWGVWETVPEWADDLLLRLAVTHNRRLSVSPEVPQAKAK